MLSQTFGYFLIYLASLFQWTILCFSARANIYLDSYQLTLDFTEVWLHIFHMLKSFKRLVCFSISSQLVSLKKMFSSSFSSFLTSVKTSFLKEHWFGIKVIGMKIASFIIFNPNLVNILALHASKLIIFKQHFNFKMIRKAETICFQVFPNMCL